MPLVLDATVGGASANAYCDRAAADAYFLGRPFADAWTALTDAQKEQLLVFATSLGEREKWAGNKGATVTAGQTQALAWPRRWAPTLEYDAQPDDLITEYFVDTTTLYYSSLTIPQPIIRGLCELALEIAKAGPFATTPGADPFSRAGDPNRDVKRKVIDVLETEYFDPGQRARGLGRFASVIALWGPVLRGAGSCEIQRA